MKTGSQDAFARTLTLFLETEDLRAVHACWDEAVISKLHKALGGAALPERLLP